MKSKHSRPKSKVSKPKLEKSKRPLRPSLTPSPELKTDLTPELSQAASTSVENSSETVQPSAEAIESNFDKAIVESKATLAETSAPKKRGRHPKACTCTSCSAKLQVSGSPAGLPVSDLPSETQTNAIPLAVDSFVIGQAIAFPFLIASKRTGFSGFELQDEEKQAVVPQVDVVLKAYMPETASPHTAAIVCCATLALVVGMKYMMYMEFQEANRPKKAPEQNQEKPKPIQTVESVGIDPNQPFPVFGN